MPIPVNIPPGALPLTDAESARGERILQEIAQVLKSGTSGASLNTPAFTTPSGDNPQTTAPLDLSTDVKQNYLRHIAIALAKRFSDLDTTNMVSHSLTRALPTTVDQTVEIGNIVLTNGSALLDIFMVVPSAGYSQSKRFIIPIEYNITGGIWHRVLPISSTGAYAGNDTDLEINVSGFTTFLRLRRVSGANSGTAYLTIVRQGVVSDSFSLTSSVSSSAAPTVNYDPSILTQVDSRVGINTRSPSETLDVNGNINSSGIIKSTNVAPAFLSFGAQAIPASVGSFFLRPWHQNITADASEVFWRIPRAGKLSNLYIQAFANNNTASTCFFIVRKNGVDQALGAILASSATQAEDVSFSFTAAAGDRISLRVQQSSGVNGTIVEPHASFQLTEI